MLKKIVKSYRSGGLKQRLMIRKGCCLYTETCSAYAERIIKEKGEVKAILLILQRILLCNQVRHRRIGVYLYDKKDISQRKSSQRKANLVLTIFLMLILSMQITGFLILKELVFKPLLIEINSKKSKL